MSLNVVPVGVAICVPLRKRRYPVTPTLSMEAVHARLIWVPDTTVVTTPVGWDGGLVSAAAVVAGTAVLGADVLPAASTAATV